MRVKWSIVTVQLALLFNSYFVTGGDDGFMPDDLTAVESRNPYVVYPQREYYVQEYSTSTSPSVLPSPQRNGTKRGSLKAYTEELKRIKNDEGQSSEGQSSEEQYEEPSQDPDQDEASSIATHRFENAYTKYNFRSDDDDVPSESARQDSIQEIIGDNRQINWENQNQNQNLNQIQNQGGSTSGRSASQAPSYNQNAYANYPTIPSYQQTPVVSYDVPSNFFPDDWTTSYGVPQASPHGDFPLSPFLGGIGQLTASVKDIKSTIGEQKAKTAYQVAEAVRNTGNAATSAILNKGNTAAAIVGQTVHTAGEVLRSKGETATRVIAGTGQLASSAVKSVGNVGASLLRSKGELIGSALRTGTELGTAALGAVSNGLAKSTYLVKAKGDAASNLVAKGGRLASGVIGTKGRIISSVINAKGQFAAQIIEAKGRGIATVLETSGQKLSQLADVIKSVTANKYQPPPVPGPNYGWSDPAASYAAPPPTTPTRSLSSSSSSSSSSSQTASPSPVYKSTSSQASNSNDYSDDIKQAKEVPLPKYPHQADYADSYYDPRDQYHNYRSSPASHNVNVPQTQNNYQYKRNSQNEEESQEQLQNEYTTYHHQPSQYNSYIRNQNHHSHATNQWE